MIRIQRNRLPWGSLKKGAAPKWGKPENGMVTAELAVSILVTVMIAMAAFWSISAGAQQLALADLATQTARQEARGDVFAIQKIKEQHPEIKFDISRSQRTAKVKLQAHTKNFGILPSLELTAEAFALLEPGEQ